MESNNPIDGIPLPLILVLTIVIVLLAIEVGYRIGVWRSKKREFDSEALLSSMTGANLALLAFIMAFSFSQAASHHSVGSTRGQGRGEGVTFLSTPLLNRL